jgi:hypothetical protein
MKVSSKSFATLLLFIVTFLKLVSGGPAAYGICQTGCNAVTVACYAAAGCTFGVATAGAGVPVAIAGCNTGLGTCMLACIAAGCLPTP